MFTTRTDLHVSLCDGSYNESLIGALVIYNVYSSCDGWYNGPIFGVLVIYNVYHRVTILQTALLYSIKWPSRKFSYIQAT